MNSDNPDISSAFMAFSKEAPSHAAAWAEMVQSLSKANTLDPKTASLAYLAVLASNGLISGVPFHVKRAKEVGANREEIISAVLIGLPAAGHRVTQALPAALAAFDE